MGPWGPTQGPLTTAIGEIQDQYAADKANPNRLIPQASDYVSRTLAGDYLDPAKNPHYGDLVRSISDPITANVTSQFSRAGRGTSASASGLGGALTRGLATGLAPTLASLYSQERGFQHGAAGMAPSLDAVANLPLDQYLERLRGIGSMGQKGTTTTTTSGSPLQTIAGLGLTAASLFGGGGPFSFLLGGGGGIPKV